MSDSEASKPIVVWVPVGRTVVTLCRRIQSDSVRCRFYKVSIVDLLKSIAVREGRSREPIRSTPQTRVFLSQTQRLRHFILEMNSTQQLYLDNVSVCVTAGTSLISNSATTVASKSNEKLVSRNRKRQLLLVEQHSRRLATNDPN